MCTVFDEIAKEGRLDGEAKGIIETGLEFGLSESDILSRLQKKLDVSLQVAQEYFVKYKRTEVFEAMEEAKRISKDQSAKRCNNFAEALDDFYNPVNQQRLYKSIERLENGERPMKQLVSKG